MDTMNMYTQRSSNSDRSWAYCRLTFLVALLVVLHALVVTARVFVTEGVPFTGARVWRFDEASGSRTLWAEGFGSLYGVAQDSEGGLAAWCKKALFRNLCVVLRICLCDVREYVSAQILGLLDLTKNGSFCPQALAAPLPARSSQGAHFCNGLLDRISHRVARPLK